MYTITSLLKVMDKYRYPGLSPKHWFTHASVIDFCSTREESKFRAVHHTASLFIILALSANCITTRAIHSRTTESAGKKIRHICPRENNKQHWICQRPARNPISLEYLHWILLFIRQTHSWNNLSIRSIHLPTYMNKSSTSPKIMGEKKN